MRQLALTIIIAIGFLAPASPAAAGTGCTYFPAERMRGAKTSACTTAQSETTPTKQLWQCANHATTRYGVTMPFWFPASSNSVAFSCEVEFRVPSGTTVNGQKASFRCRYQVGVAASSWDAVDGELPSGTGLSAFGNGTLTATSMVTIVATPSGTFDAWNTTTNAACASVAACKDRHGVVLVERGGTTSDTAATAFANNVQIEGVKVCWTTD